MQVSQKASSLAPILHLIFLNNFSDGISSHLCVYAEEITTFSWLDIKSDLINKIKLVADVQNEIQSFVNTSKN